MHWIWYHSGLANGSYVWYLLWSGIAGSFLVSSGIWHNSYVTARKHNCHQQRCWRVGRHVIDGTPWCNRHHNAARAAVPGESPPDPLMDELRGLREDISGLAEAIRAALPGAQSERLVPFTPPLPKSRTTAKGT